MNIYIYILYIYISYYIYIIYISWLLYPYSIFIAQFFPRHFPAQRASSQVEHGRGQGGHHQPCGGDVVHHLPWAMGRSPLGNSHGNSMALYRWLRKCVYIYYIDYIYVVYIDGFIPVFFLDGFIDFYVYIMSWLRNVKNRWLMIIMSISNWGKNGDLSNYIYYLVMTNIAMERSTMLLIGKPR